MIHVYRNFSRCPELVALKGMRPECDASPSRTVHNFGILLTVETQRFNLKFGVVATYRKFGPAAQILSALESHYGYRV